MAQDQGKKKRKGRKEFTKYKHLSKEQIEAIKTSDNQELVGRASLEYKNYKASKKLQAGDTDIAEHKTQIKDLKRKVEESDEYIALKLDFELKKEELTIEKLGDEGAEHLATLEEELKNLNAPYAEDTARFRSAFECAIDEINLRKEAGLLKIDVPV